ncbi:MAG: hypothetical protein MUF04_14460 [Akkermansiaceae bacterium]|nr:hypothetical protein [Akkermansiaceae bacterium]
MKRIPVIALCGLLLATGWPDSAAASQIRGYTPARHDRFTGFPAAPVWNGAAWFDSLGFTGVGWQANATRKQYALVSPRHAVFATHFLPPVGTTLRFLNADGAIMTRTVSARQPVKNDNNADSDLTLITLSTPFTEADKVGFFPYLALPSEEAYAHTSLVVFGWNAKAGHGRLAGIDDYEGEGLNLTRLLRFDYRIGFGGQDDTYLEGNDSGSPSFAMVDGRPALVGTHTSIGINSQFRQNFDTFVPHYVDALNALMAADGYQMTPSHAAPVTFSITATPAPEVLLQQRPASQVFQVTNTSANEAANVAIVLRFIPGREPDALTAPGWTVSTGEPGERLLQRASLAAAETSAITAEWDDAGGTDFLESYLDAQADELAELSYDFTALLALPYAVWAADLDDPAPEADDDGDGTPNLMEYASGGSEPFLSLAVAGDTATLAFPVRQHGEALGLEYVVEFSDTLAADSWSAEAPPGTVVSDGELTPFKAGFTRREVKFPAAVPRRFCRVRVILTENAAE